MQFLRLHGAGISPATGNYNNLRGEFNEVCNLSSNRGRRIDRWTGRLRRDVAQEWSGWDIRDPSLPLALRRSVCKRLQGVTPQGYDIFRHDDRLMGQERLSLAEWCSQSKPVLAGKSCRITVKTPWP